MTNGNHVRIDPKRLKFHRSRIEPTDPAELAARNERRLALAQSWLENPITDILVRAGDLAVANGNERVAGLQRLGVEEITVLLLPAETTDAELDEISMLDDYFKTKLTQIERACLAKRLKETLRIRNKELAVKLRVNAGYLTKTLALFKCHPAVLEAATAGKIGVNDWWIISKSPDQLKALKRRLAGAPREQMQRDAKPKDAAPRETTQRIKIPLAVNTEDVSVNGIATVAGKPGQKISLEDAENILKEALKAVREAQKRKLDIKTFQVVMRDMAAAENTPKTPEQSMATVA